MTEHDRVIKALATVPEKNLLIIDLAGQLVTDGALNYELASERTPEINLAVAEARVYARATVTAINALKAIPARGSIPVDTTVRDLEEYDEALDFIDENQEAIFGLVHAAQAERERQVGR